MKNKKIVYGLLIGGVAFLVFKLTRKKPEEVKVETQVKLDTTDIPKECINGFELNGKKYFIKDNQFVKE